MGQSWRPGFIPVAIVVALALAFTSASAQATSGGRIAAACSNETVNGGTYAGKLTLRFVLHGKVSCSKAHRLLGTYFHDMTTPGCRLHGTACIFAYPAGWSCSLPIPALHIKAIAECATSTGQPTARVTVFKVSSAASPASGKLPQPIYFWDSIAATIRAPGRPPLSEVVRPSLIFLFADGSWDIDHLHWTGWGSSAAHASGISSASNGNPSEAGGKRIKTPGQITLSHPGRFYGREVYRCFALTVRPPATSLHGCLEGHGGYYGL